MTDDRRTATSNGCRSAARSAVSSGFGGFAISLRDQLVGDARAPLYVLQAGVIVAAADRVRQRRQPAADARHWPLSRARHPHDARRGTVAA
mgnify:CR=1 FL=1